MALYYTLYSYTVELNYTKQYVEQTDGRGLYTEATALLCEGKQSRSVHSQHVNFVKRITYRASSYPYFPLL
jgi:hypothetical protein